MAPVVPRQARNMWRSQFLKFVASTMLWESLHRDYDVLVLIFGPLSMATLCGRHVRHLLSMLARGSGICAFTDQKFTGRGEPKIPILGVLSS